MDYIPTNKLFLILDLFDTVIWEPVNMSDVWEVRPGFSELVEYLKAKYMKGAICSDVTTDRVQEKLGWARSYLEEQLRDNFIGIYGADNLPLVEQDGTTYKNLGQLCNIAKVNPIEAVMCGDNHRGLDQRSCKFYNIHFIPVPNGRQDPYFSLSSLIPTD